MLMQHDRLENLARPALKPAVLSALNHGGHVVDWIIVLAKVVIRIMLSSVREPIYIGDIGYYTG